MAASCGDDAPFWRRKRLDQMTAVEWEALCDGCARCCLHKLIDDDDDGDGEIVYTNIACRLLDPGACRCTDYARRRELVPDCVILTAARAQRLSWMPSTCAYRLVAEGRDLAWWHPLVSGDPNTVHEAGISVRGRTVAESRAGDPEDHIAAWPA